MGFVQFPEGGSEEARWQRPEHVQQHFGQAYPHPPQQQWRMAPRHAQVPVPAAAVPAPLPPGQGQPPAAPLPGPGRGGWRWVAHPPFGAPGAPPHPEVENWWRRRRAVIEDFRRRTEPSPRYARPPRWGLPHVPAPGTAAGQASDADTRTRLAAAHRVLLARLAGWLVVAAVVAAVIGWGRYALLVALRGQVVPAWVQWLSAGAVYLANAAALLLSLAVLAVLVRWLLAERARRRSGRPDPRRPGEVAALAVIPGLNLVYLPVLGRETAGFGGPAPDRRARRAATVAWAALAVAQLLGALYWWQLLAPGAQSAANALSLGAAMAATTAVSAAALRHMLRAAPARRRLVAVGLVAASPADDAAEKGDDED